jgi:hypothetical protein
MSSAAETSLSIPSRGRVDHHAVGWICHSDINDAKRCIREANAATLSSALRELALQKNAPNIVRRKLIAIRQRRLKKEAA